MKLTKAEKKELELAQKWNEANPVGTEVIVTEDDQTKTITKTTSTAWMLGKSGDYPGHTAVIGLEGKSGGFLLSRLKPKIKNG